jgi:hypothetical protein
MLDVGALDVEALRIRIHLRIVVGAARDTVTLSPKFIGQPRMDSSRCIAAGVRDGRVVAEDL